MTFEKYDHVTGILKGSGSSLTLHSHSSMRQRYLSLLVRNNFASSAIQELPVSKSIQKSGGSAACTRPVPVVKPTTLVSLNVRSANLLEDLFCAKVSFTSSRRTIHKSLQLEDANRSMHQTSSSGEGINF